MTEPADVVRTYLASFATRDPDTIAAHVTDGFVNDHASALGGRCEGVEEYRRRLPGFLERLQGLHYEVGQVIADGQAVAAAYTLTATAEGHPITIRGVMLFDVVDGRIARRTDYWDSLGFLRQTGQA